MPGSCRNTISSMEDKSLHEMTIFYKKLTELVGFKCINNMVFFSKYELKCWSLPHAQQILEATEMVTSQRPNFHLQGKVTLSEYVLPGTVKGCKDYWLLWWNVTGSNISRATYHINFLKAPHHMSLTIRSSSGIQNYYSQGNCCASAIVASVINFKCMVPSVCLCMHS